MRTAIIFNLHNRRAEVMKGASAPCATRCGTGAMHPRLRKQAGFGGMRGKSPRESGEDVLRTLDCYDTDCLDLIADQISAYPNNPAARTAITPQAKRLQFCG
jgi:hypothetical protein